MFFFFVLHAVDNHWKQLTSRAHVCDICKDFHSSRSPSNIYFFIYNLADWLKVPQPWMKRFTDLTDDLLNVPKYNLRTLKNTLRSIFLPRKEALGGDRYRFIHLSDSFRKAKITHEQYMNLKKKITQEDDCQLVSIYQSRDLFILSFSVNDLSWSRSCRIWSLSREHGER